MPPPIFVFYIPGVALFFFIQILICQAYHFHVRISHTRTKSNQKDKAKSMPDKKNNSKEQGRPKFCCQATDDENRDEPFESENDETGPNGSKVRSPVYKEPKEDDAEISGDEDAGAPQRRLVGFKEPDHNKNPQQPRSQAPESAKENTGQKKDSFLKQRRKSVFAESYDPSNDEDDEKVVHQKTPDEKKWLVDNVCKITLFQHLARDQINTVVDAMYKYPVSEGDFIVRQGDHGSTFYVIQSGMYYVYVKDEHGSEKLIHTYRNEGSFGELALLYNQPRAASVMAYSDGILWAVDGQTFRKIVSKITHRKRMMYESLINNVPALKALEPYERANLVDALVPMTFQHGQLIIKQGEEADGMYFIISGSVKIMMKTSSNKEILLKELSNGDYFGELALITNKPRAASAYAVGTTYAAFLDREAFERLLGPCMDVIRRNISDYDQRKSEALMNHI